MITKIRFYRMDDTKQWYADLPNYLLGENTSVEDLLMMAGADEWLEHLSKGNGEITLKVSNKLISNETGRLIAIDVDVKGEGWYMESPSLKHMWLCDVTKHVFGDYPKTIYYKIV